MGRLSPEKRIGDLLEAMTHLGAAHQLLLIGDGPARRSLGARAANLGLGSRVRFAPFVSDRHALARAYRQAACVIDPGP